MTCQKVGCGLCQENARKPLCRYLPLFEVAPESTHRCSQCNDLTLQSITRRSCPRQSPQSRSRGRDLSCRVRKKRPKAHEDVRERYTKSRCPWKQPLLRQDQKGELKPRAGPGSRSRFCNGSNLETPALRTFPHSKVTRQLDRVHFRAVTYILFENDRNE